MRPLKFFDQELTFYRYFLLVVVLVGVTSSKKAKAASFQIGSDEIRQVCSSCSKYASNDSQNFDFTSQFQDGSE